MTSATGLAILGAFVLAAVIWTWILAPLFQGAASVPPPDPRIVALLAEREAAAAELRDLERDHADGRLAEGDFRRMRGDVVARGARIMAALDRLTARQEGHVAAEAARIQSAVERRLDGRSTVSDPSAGRSDGG